MKEKSKSTKSADMDCETYDEALAKYNRWGF